ncbi:MAG: pyruvate kinase [Pseudomonadota bacterium]
MPTPNAQPRQTKIIATLGPASNTADKIKALALSGANVFRMNFSHGAQKDHALVHAAIRLVEAELGQSIAILADLQGPKLRIGAVPGGAMPVEIGDLVTFCAKDPTADQILLPHGEVFGTVAIGHLVLIDDGRIRLKVTSTGENSFTARVLNTAILRDRKGINFPDTPLSIDAITDKDRSDLEFALGLGVDWVAMSFVQRAQDIAQLRGLIGDRAKIIAKIEKPVAVSNISAILEETDAIMVARGDLGVECDWFELPAIQASLVAKARASGKPVVVATQMLESMITAPLPTRAETSDVSNAVVQQADAVMLSAESAAGEYPVEAVSAMAAIASATEAASRASQATFETPIINAPDDSSSIASAAGVLAQLRDACCIATYTETGATALRVSKTRSAVPIVAVCPTAQVARPLSLVWGVTPVINANAEEFSASREGRIPPQLAPDSLIQPNRPVVVTSGSTHGQSGGTDSLKIAYLNA